MKKITLTLAGVIGCCIVLCGQSKKTITIPYEKNTTFLTEQDKLMIDLAYDEIPEGSFLVIEVIPKTEEKENYKYRTRLSAKRAETVSNYLLRKKLLKKNIFVGITPVHKKGKTALATLATRKFVRCGGIYSIHVRKPLHEPVDYTGCSCNALHVKDACEHLIDPKEDTVISCPSGTVLEIPANTFVRRDGNMVGCDRIKITVHEFLSNEDILAAGLMTQSGKSMLETRGMVHLSATCNGEEVKIGGVNRISLYIPNNSDCLPDMKIFQGGESNSNIDWKEFPGSKVTCGTAPSPVVSVPDSTDQWNNSEDWEGEGNGEREVSIDEQQLYYVMGITKLGWINCDRFYNVSDKTNLIVKTDTSFHPTVVIVFENYKSIMQGYYFTPDKKIKFGDIPANEPVTLLAYSINKDKTKVMLGYKSITLGDDLIETIEMSPSSLEEFNSFMKNLEN